MPDPKQGDRRGDQQEDPIQHDLLVGQVAVAQPQPFNGTFARHSRADSRALTKAGAWLKLN